MQIELRLEHVFKRYQQKSRELEVLADLNMTFVKGRSYALMGPSGAGKSTLLQLLSGLIEPSTGAVFYHGRDLATMSEREHEEYLLHRVGLIFQTPHLIEELSVIENVMLKGFIAGYAHEKSREHARKLLDFVGLASKENELPALLSGGQAQRVAIARALFITPEFILADEPTAHLDEYHKEVILKLLCQARDEFGVGLIIASHDETVAHVCDERIDLHD